MPLALSGLLAKETRRKTPHCDAKSKSNDLCKVSADDRSVAPPSSLRDIRPVTVRPVIALNFAAPTRQYRFGAWTA